MNIKSYLNFYELLENNTISREENRAFGLSHEALKNRPIEQLMAWEKEHLASLTKPTLGEKFTLYIYNVTLFLGVIAFILGLFSGIGLLSYNGHEPVNVIYFMAMVIFLPLFTMFLTLISMLRANSSQSFLIHVSPAFWMEKILSFLPHKMQEEMKEFKINPLLLNWVVIKRSQLIALFFSIGLLIALLAMVVTKDIAFSWSTTLHISPEAFHTFLETIASPWKAFYPSAVPTVELIEHSQYFRLGDKLSQEMISNASKLGEWWKFLVMSTLFYAIFLRFLMFLLASFGLNKAIKKSYLTLNGVNKLLTEMNEPIITTQASQKEKVFVSTNGNYDHIINNLDESYDMVQGWAISKEKLVVLSDSMHLTSSQFFEVGGANSFKEDSEIISKSHGEILLFVKGWEPPTMDFIDYLKELSQNVDKIVVTPIGTVKNEYKIDVNAVDVWDRKLSQINDAKVWLKR